jgi:hypothetical protein
MTQLLPRRRRSTRPAQIHPRKPAHQVCHPTSRSTLHRRLRSRRTIKQAHNICHPTRLRRRWRRSPSPNPSGTGNTIRRARGTLLGTRRRGAIEIDIQQILHIVLRRASAIGRPPDCSDRRSDGVFGKVLALFLDGGALDGLGAEAALADEGLGGLVVDRGEGGELGEELLEEDGREEGEGCRNGGFLGEDDVLGGC